MARSRTRRNLLIGLAFLGPNILGFMAFTLFPLVFSLYMAFTNWDLRLHNMFKTNQLQFVAFENFTRLFTYEPDFWRFFGNTLFLMIGLPLGIAGSLGAAILLTQNLKTGRGFIMVSLVGGVGVIGGLTLLMVMGMGVTGIGLLICSITCLILVGASLGGMTIYRTLFYMPCFTAGVATYLLWKKLYNPHTGPINTLTQPVLDQLAVIVNALPDGLVQQSGWLLALCMILAAIYGARLLHRNWLDGEMGWQGVALGFILLAPPVFCTESALFLASAILPVFRRKRLAMASWFPADS
jgi:multiple sugar transport system permease protein